MSRSATLVDADWVEQHLDDDTVVFVEVDEDTSAYDKGHIPGSVKLVDGGRKKWELESRELTAEATERATTSYTAQDHDTSILGTDSTGDTFPLPYPKSPTVHILAEVYLGLPVMHSLQLEALADACAAAGRTEFLLMVAPLNMEGATGSPVSPVCVL